MPTLVEKFYTLSDREKSFSVFSTTIGIALIFFFAITYIMRNRSEDSMKPYERSQSLINQYVDSLGKPTQLETKYFTVFKTQQKILAFVKNITCKWDFYFLETITAYWFY